MRIGLSRLARVPRPALVGIALAIVALVGAVDHVTGLEFSVDLFYLLPVALAVWFVGPRSGVVLAVASAATSFAVNGLPRAPSSRLLPECWNALILLSFFLVFVWILSRFRELNLGLEQRVQQRTADLRREMLERERLERQLLDVSERERQRIGRDLHDTLCQQLTAAALAAKALTEQLENGTAPAAEAARRVVGMVEDGINMARGLAHGLAPVDMTGAGLMEAFEELAEAISERVGIDCRFECDVPVPIAETATATHLYRIAQEAIHNSIQHGQATRIDVTLDATDAGTTLEIRDDGVGMPEPAPVGRGMGLRTMAYRAAMIGGRFDVRRGIGGGTVVTCTVP